MNERDPADPASRNIDEVARLERREDRSQSIGERLSIAITNAAGTG